SPWRSSRASGTSLPRIIRSKRRRSIRSGAASSSSRGSGAKSCVTAGLTPAGPAAGGRMVYARLSGRGGGRCGKAAASGTVSGRDWSSRRVVRATARQSSASSGVRRRVRRGMRRASTAGGGQEPVRIIRTHMSREGPDIALLPYLVGIALDDPAPGILHHGGQLAEEAHGDVTLIALRIIMRIN